MHRSRTRASNNWLSLQPVQSHLPYGGAQIDLTDGILRLKDHFNKVSFRQTKRTSGERRGDSIPSWIISEVSQCFKQIMAKFKGVANSVLTKRGIKVRDGRSSSQQIQRLVERGNGIVKTRLGIGGRPPTVETGIAGRTLLKMG